MIINVHAFYAWYDLLQYMWALYTTRVSLLASMPKTSARCTRSTEWSDKQPSQIRHQVAGPLPLWLSAFCAKGLAGGRDTAKVMQPDRP
jgi:hypothetical protein